MESELESILKITFNPLVFKIEMITQGFKGLVLGRKNSAEPGRTQKLGSASASPHPVPAPAGEHSPSRRPSSSSPLCLPRRGGVLTARIQEGTVDWSSGENDATV